MNQLCVTMMVKAMDRWKRNSDGVLVNDDATGYANARKRNASRIKKKDELEEEGIGETYHIEGSTVEYKCMVMGKEIGFDMELIENSDGTYTFQIGTLEFAVVTLKGNKFSYTVGEGHDASTMYFERQK